MFDKNRFLKRKMHNIPCAIILDILHLVSLFLPCSRTNIMIIAISISFFLSWLPLNTLNTLLGRRGGDEAKQTLAEKQEF